LKECFSINDVRTLVAKHLRVFAGAEITDDDLNRYKSLAI